MIIFKWVSLAISIVVFVRVIELGVKWNRIDSNQEEENKKIKKNRSS